MQSPVILVKKDEHFEKIGTSESMARHVTFMLDISAKKKKIKKRAQLLHAALSEKLKNGLFVENSQILWPGKITPSNSVLDCPAL